jgi:hypothetical protein
MGPMSDSQGPVQNASSTRGTTQKIPPTPVCEQNNAYVYRNKAFKKSRKKTGKNYIGESLNYFTCIDMIQDVSMHHLPTCLPFTPLSRLTIEGSRFQAMQFLSLCTV